MCAEELVASYSGTWPGILVLHDVAPAPHVGALPPPASLQIICWTRYPPLVQLVDGNGRNWNYSVTAQLLTTVGSSTHGHRRLQKVETFFMTDTSPSPHSIILAFLSVTFIFGAGNHVLRISVSQHCHSGIEPLLHIALNDARFTLCTTILRYSAQQGDKNGAMRVRNETSWFIGFRPCERAHQRA